MAGMAAAGAGVGAFGSILDTAGKYLGRPKKIKVPDFMPQENYYNRGIRQNLNAGRDVMGAGLGQWGMIAPYGYEELGFTPTYQDNTEQLTNAQNYYTTSSQALNDARTTITSLEAKKKSGQKLSKEEKDQLKQAKKGQKAAKIQQDDASRQLQYWQANPKTITGLEKGPGAKAFDEGLARQDALTAGYQTATERYLRGDFEGADMPGLFNEGIRGELAGRGPSDDLLTGYRNKVRAALSGDLPDNPRLIRQLNEERQLLENKTRASLGGAGALSSAGMRMRANSDQRRLETLDAARRSDLTTYGNLLTTGEESKRRNLGVYTAASRGFGQDRVDATRTYGGLAQLGMESGSNLRGSRLRQLSFMPQTTQGMGSNMLAATSPYLAAQDPFYRQRQMQFAAEQYNSTIPSDWAAGLMVSGEGHKEVGAALGAGGMMGGGGG